MVKTYDVELEDGVNIFSNTGGYSGLGMTLTEFIRKNKVNGVDFILKSVMKKCPRVNEKKCKLSIKKILYNINNKD